MTIKVSMFPHRDELQPEPISGISAVVVNYFKYLPDLGIELLPPGADDPDLVAVHAGGLANPPMTIPMVAHNHGLYWTADKDMGVWTNEMNEAVIDIARRATTITVPSSWVAEVFKRDMHLRPAIIPHGVNWDDWQEGVGDEGYVLWNKNRASDACDPKPVNELATRAPRTRFLTTYAAPNPRPNIRQTGTMDHASMRQMILNCSVYLATTKETFGIGTLEAMAAGKPVLGFNYGGTADLVKHGYSGYLAAPGDYEDLAQGLAYCQEHAVALGANGRKAAKHFTWQRVADQVAAQYALTVDLDRRQDDGTVAVVIPLYNKASTILRAVRSVLAQTRYPECLIVVNNNSTDDYGPELEKARAEAEAVGMRMYVYTCEQQGVAHARNMGIAHSTEDFIVCLDADDEMLPDFIDKCRRELVWDRSLGIVYAAMEVVFPDGRIQQSQWPGEFDFDAMLKGRNQVPTCCMFRREAWRRAGGFRQRYAPGGAGSEDADLWLRIFLLGFDGKLVASYPLFRYYLGGIVSGNPEYREKDWRGDKGWLLSAPPFAAVSTPADGMSHPVRQYDEPQISVIIPVGPGHINTVIDAIDSVEGQTFRKWELIVVDDDRYHGEFYTDRWRQIHDAFPFINMQMTLGNEHGAGVARNIGASVAKAPLLLFLDADDWLVPTALDEMMRAHKENPDAIIYSDYIGHAYIEPGPTLHRLQLENRLLEYNERTLEAKVMYHAYDFDCVRAQNQPIEGDDPYIWNVISSLVPKSYHEAIGGFDQEMESWEDWDYWVRLAKAGKCFYRLDRPLLEYRFFTGKRRSLANPGESGESGRQLSTHLLQYMRSKYEGIEIMPCSSCGGRSKRSGPLPQPVSMSSFAGGNMSQQVSSEMVMVELIDGNVGDHLVAFQGQSYGYRAHGQQFMMRRDHAALDRRVRVVGQSAAASGPQAQPLPPPPAPEPEAAKQSAAKGVVQKTFDTMRAMSTAPAPSAEDDPPADTGPEPDDLVAVWGINEERAETLLKMGVRSFTGVVMLGEDGIAKALELPELTVRRMIADAKRLIAEKEAPAPAAKKKVAKK